MYTTPPPAAESHFDPLYRVSDVCRWLDLSRAAVESLIRRGELPIVRVGAARHTRVRHSVIVAYLRAHEERGPRRPRLGLEGDLLGNEEFEADAGGAR